MSEKTQAHRYPANEGAGSATSSRRSQALIAAVTVSLFPAHTARRVSRYLLWPTKCPVSLRPVVSEVQGRVIPPYIRNLGYTIGTGTFLFWKTRKNSLSPYIDSTHKILWPGSRKTFQVIKSLSLWRSLQEACFGLCTYVDNEKKWSTVGGTSSERPHPS